MMQEPTNSIHDDMQEIYPKLIEADAWVIASPVYWFNESGHRATDGPFAEAKEVIGGIFTIDADSYDEAVEISKDCPHLKYGGWIEVREVEPTS